MEAWGGQSGHHAGMSGTQVARGQAESDMSGQGIPADGSRPFSGMVLYYDSFQGEDIIVRYPEGWYPGDAARMSVGAAFHAVRSVMPGILL